MVKSYFDATGMSPDTIEPPRFSMERQPPEIFDDRGRSVPWMMRTLDRLYDVKAQKILDREKISIAHWYYLSVLAQSGELNQLELSKRVGIASTTAVPALDSMERRGFLKRTRDPADRRRYYVCLTDHGRRLVRELMPEIVGMISGSFDGVAPDEIITFWKVLHRIASHLSEASVSDDTGGD